MFNFFGKKKDTPFIKINADGTFELSKKYISYADLALIDEVYSEALAAAVLSFNNEDKVRIQRANLELMKIQEDIQKESNDDDVPFVRAINAFTNHTNS